MRFFISSLPLGDIHFLVVVPNITFPCCSFLINSLNICLNLIFWLPKISQSGEDTCWQKSSFERLHDALKKLQRCLTKRDKTQIWKIFVIQCKEKVSRIFIAGSVSFTVLFFRSSLWRHVLQFRVQFPVQVGLFVGVHGRILLSAAGVKNPFLAYSHPSVRLCFIATAVNLKQEGKHKKLALKF